MTQGDAQSKVSVIIPVYNAREYLHAALQSVLDQTYRHLEIIVIDDGSTDGSTDAIADIRDPRLRVVRQENTGKSGAMNRALSMITGEFYLINDADDLSHPSRIERQLRCLQENPGLAAVFCGHEIIVNGRTMAPQSRAKGEEECRAEIQTCRMPAHDPTGMYRLSIVGQLRYVPELSGAEGYDYILRIGEQYPIRVLGECLYAYRIHDKSVTSRAREECERRVRETVRRACERRGQPVEQILGSTDSRRRPRNETMGNSIATHFIESVIDLRAQGRFLEAVRTGLNCVRCRPTDPHYSKALVYSLLPSGVVRRLRARRAKSPTVAVPGVPGERS